MENSEKIIYCCSECPMTFLRPESFKKHMKTIHQVTVVVCSSCPLYFEDLGKLFLHARQIHNVNRDVNMPPKKHQCEHENCFYQTDNGGLFRHHMRSHLNLKPFTCVICKKQFTQKSNMKTHFNRHKKNEIQFNCEPCEKQFNSYDTYLSHLETREHQLGTYNASKVIKMFCITCQAEFESPEDIYNHISECQRFDHLPISCELCFAKLPHDLEAIKDHFNKHKKEIICPYCPDFNSFTCKIKLNLHLTKVHNERVSRRPACRYCEQTFNNEEERSDHINTEHKDLKNKHLSRDDFGKINCPILGCNFSTNSLIMSETHFYKHFGNVIDKDSRYQTKLDPQPVQETQTAPPVKKRGRPRLCDGIPHSETSLLTTDTSLEIAKRKRGRPKKVVTNEKEEETQTMIKPRGRPKRIKLETVQQMAVKLGVMEDVDIKGSVDYNIDEFETLYNSLGVADNFSFLQKTEKVEESDIQQQDINEENQLSCSYSTIIEDNNYDAFNNFEEFINYC